MSQTMRAETLISVGDTLPPWLYYEQSTAKGILMDTFIELANRMGHQLQMNVVPFRRIYSELLAGRAQVSVLLVSEEENNYPPQLLLGKEPLFSYRVVGVALKSRRLKLETIDQFKQLRLGHIRLLPEITDKITSGAESTAYGNDRMMLKGLITGRIDIAVASEPTLFDVSKRLGIYDELEVVYTLGFDQFYLVWSRPALVEKTETIAQQADLALREMKQEGRLAEILSDYSDKKFFSDYGLATP